MSLTTCYHNSGEKSEISARVLVLRNFAEMKPSQNGEVNSPLTGVGKSCTYTSPDFFNIANMSLNVIRENKILAKKSEFTVLWSHLISE